MAYYNNMLYYNKIYFLCMRFLCENMYHFFTETYEIARKIEKEAADISTSEEGRFENLSHSSIQDLKKRLIKKPRFHDELDDGYNNSNYYLLLFHSYKHFILIKYCYGLILYNNINYDQLLIIINYYYIIILIISYRSSNKKTSSVLCSSIQQY